MDGRRNSSQLSHFPQVSIDPPDAEVSETYVPKDGDPPGPAQAAFNGLIPGKDMESHYNYPNNA